MGYKRTEADHAVFIRMHNGAHSIIALYINDITMVSKNLETINQDKEALKKHYEMMDLGEIAWILGMSPAPRRGLACTPPGLGEVGEPAHVKKFSSCLPLVPL